MIQTDVLIIGSGAAGLYYALNLASKVPNSQIIIVTKSTPDESNTKYAQGGIAVVWDKIKDNFESHIQDTLRAGDGQCNRSVVETVVKDAPLRIQDLIDAGVMFDFDEQGNYDLGREGGHSFNRVIHHKDNTGEAIEKVLLDKVKLLSNVSILQFHQAIDLLQDDNKSCIGASVLDIERNKTETIFAQITVLATGGCGTVYENTTNPNINTGDGIALVTRLGGKVSNLQYIQFHPTAMYQSEKGQLPLITEAIRGAGAKLLNIQKEPFMKKYDERGELASRDIVSRAIYEEMRLHESDYVYLDCREIESDILHQHFPNIYVDCLDQGYDLKKDLLPIVPASHYLCGGIDVDANGQTTISNLFAIGECSNTGLHGANRLASNSLLEALVYGHKTAMFTADLLPNIELSDQSRSVIKQYSISNDPSLDETLDRLRRKLKKIMSQYVGIVRTNVGLKQALADLHNLESAYMELGTENIKINIKILEFRNMLAVSLKIIEQSLEQKANFGTYFNKDLDVERTK